MADEIVRPVLEVWKYAMGYQTEDGLTPILKDVSLNIARGETHALVGESGSGKSTLAWAIMRYLAPNAREGSGAILLSGEDLIGKSKRDMGMLRGRRIAMVFQDPSMSLNPTMRLGEQIAEVLMRHRRLPRAEAWKEAESALARTGISSPAQMMNRFPHEASGGEKQRVLIATAFACDPELIIFDEPTTALDVLTSEQILGLFRKLRAETGVAALYISHDLGLVAQIADTVSVIHKGTIIEAGPIAEVFAYPKMPYTQKLLAALPRPENRIAVPPPGDDKPLFEAQRISVAYGAPGLLTRLLAPGTKAYLGADDVSLDVRPGELLGIVGESGSGKSTLAKAATGLADYTGTFRFDGKTYSSGTGFDKDYRRAVQLVFQHPDGSLNPRETIATILSRPLKLYGLADRADIPAEIARMLEEVQLPPDYARRYPHQLSGGEKQRVAIARAFAAKPRLVICDEVTAALDVSVQAVVAKLLVDLQRKTGAACIFITHDLNLVRQIAHRIAVMYRSHLVDFFDVADAESPDRNDYTRALLNAVRAPQHIEEMSR